MGDYESGYDSKYGYNKNAFAHKTPVTALLGKTVKLIATPIGLASEAIHDHKDKKRAEADAASVRAVQGTTAEDSVSGPSGLDSQQDVYINVPPEDAEALISSGQGVAADGQAATHEFVPQKEKGEEEKEEEDGDDGIEYDEEDWALDDAIEEAENAGEPPIHTVTEGQKKASTTFSSMLKSKDNTNASLPFPVIVPQRRPGAKARGFVRAYAPILQDSGIDEKQFLEFLKNFHKAAQASPIFNVVMLATALVGVYPDVIVGAVVQAVQIAAMIGQEAQERWRTNGFLDSANKEIFLPKGLFALIVTYKPGKSDNLEIGTETVDLGATAMAKYGDNLFKQKGADGEILKSEKGSKMDEMKEKMKRLRVSSGETQENETPVVCAPLTFPALDAFADASVEESQGQGTAQKLMAKSKDASKYVNSYMDRRAQATYAAMYPDSTLTKQMGDAAPKFKSRFADPNNHTNMHLFTLLTGGHYKAQPLGARRRWEKAQRKAAEAEAQGRRQTPSKRMLSESVLYLMVVNMPTEQELEKAKNSIQAAKEQKEKAKEKEKEEKAA